MSNVEMSLSEALVRKKTYEKKIKKATMEISNSTSRGIGEKSNSTVCDIIVGESKTTEGTKLSEEDFTTNAKSFLTSCKALLSNYDTLCKAINRANNETTLIIGGKEMTIVEAIALKSNPSMSLKQALATKLSMDFQNASIRFDRITREVNDQDNINNYLKSIMSESEKNSPEEISKYESLYHEKRDPRLIDPLKAMELANTMADDITSFFDEVDFKLTEINSVTKITVEFED